MLMFSIEQFKYYLKASVDVEVETSGLMGLESQVVFNCRPYCLLKIF